LKGWCITLLNWIKKYKWELIFLIIIILALYFILPVSIPLILALITAIVLNPFVNYIIHKTKWNRNIAVISVFIIFILLVGFSGTILITKATAQILLFVERIPDHFNEIYRIYKVKELEFRQYTQNLPPEFFRQISSSIEENLLLLNETIREKLTLENVAQIFTKIPQYLISLIVYAIALFLFMLDLPLLKAKAFEFLKEETAEKVSFMGQRLGDVLLGFIKAQFLVSIVIFVISLLALLIITPEVAIMMSLIIWIIDLIPIIGSIIILGPWALYMFSVDDVSTGIQLAILAIVLLAVRRIMEPKLMGQHIGLSPLATLIAMFLGIKLLGITGFILGPLLVIAFTSAKEAGIISFDLKI